MTRATGGSKVDGGYYWNPKNWEVEIVPEGGGQLAAAPDTTYLKLPLLVALPVAAMVGATFLMSLPMIGFIVFFAGIGSAILGKGKDATPKAPGGAAKH